MRLPRTEQRRREALHVQREVVNLTAPCRPHELRSRRVHRKAAEFVRGRRDLDAQLAGGEREEVDGLVARAGEVGFVMTDADGAA